MSALPCVSHFADIYAHELGQETARQEYIEMRAEQLSAEYRNDEDMLWTSVGNVTASEAKDHPALINALRIGGSEAEMAAAMNYLRNLVLNECDRIADYDAEREIQSQEGLWI